MFCEQFDSSVVGGSWFCDSYDEFGECELNCSTGKFYVVITYNLLEFNYKGSFGSDCLFMLDFSPYKT